MYEKLRDHRGEQLRIYLEKQGRRNGRTSFHQHEPVQQCFLDAGIRLDPRNPVAILVRKTRSRPNWHYAILEHAEREPRCIIGSFRLENGIETKQ
jgi:hypothetical protein